MAVPTEGTIACAEKLAELVEKAPAGGIFHDAIIPAVAGIEVPGYAGFAGFSITIPDEEIAGRIGKTERVYEVVVQRVR